MNISNALSIADKAANQHLQKKFQNRMQGQRENQPYLILIRLYFLQPFISNGRWFQSFPKVSPQVSVSLS
jgi:hypothetical protein